MCKMSQKRKRLPDAITNWVIENRLSVMVSQITCESIITMHQRTANLGDNVPHWNRSFTSKLFFPLSYLTNTYRLPKNLSCLLPSL